MNFFRRHKKLTIFLGIFLILFLSILVYLVIGALKVRASYVSIVTDVQGIEQGQKQKSFPVIVQHAQQLQTDIQGFQSTLGYFAPLRLIPFTSGYLSNADYLSNAALSVTKGALKIAHASAPIADSFGYGNTTITDGSAKIANFVNALPVLTPAIDDAQNDFNDAESYIALVDPTYLPSITIKGVNIHNAFLQYKDTFSNAVNFLPKIDSIAPVIARALGDPMPETYLLLVQNDNELRPTGGFISAYGYLVFDHGNMGDIHTDDIYSLDKIETRNPPAPILLQEYNAATLWYLRDSNISPDIPTAGEQAKKFYTSIPIEKRKNVNGFVYIDTQFVASLLNAVGPVYIPEYKLTVTPDNLSYNLEYYSEKVSDQYNGANRKQFINLLMDQIKKKVFSAQKDQLLNLISIGFKDLDEKHLQIYVDDQQVEKLLDEYGWTGTFPQYHQQDFFAMVEANLGGAKADMYIKRQVSQKVQKTSRGYLKTVNITFSNNQIYDDWLNGPYKAWIRFYLPKGSQLVSIQNFDGTLRQYAENGYSVIDDHIRVPVKYNLKDPAAKLTVTLSYYLPSYLDFSNGYSIYVFKQAGLKDLPVDVTYNGETKSQDLVKDAMIAF